MAKKIKKVSKKEALRIEWSTYKKHIRWNFNKGYRIYPVTKNNLQYKIAIELGVKKAILSTEWEKKEVDWAIADAHALVYGKHND